jgi:hypothetical protein
MGKGLVVFFIILSFVFVKNTMAQDSTKSFHRKKLNVEILLNPTSTITRLVSGKDLALANFDNTYLAGLKFLYQHECLRSSFGLSTFSNINMPLAGEPLITSKYKLKNYRVGYEHKFRMGKKWECGVGLDFVWFTNDSTKSIKSSFDDIEIINNNTFWGFGPVTNLQYNFNRNISISVESFGYLTHYNRNNSTIYQLTPELNSVIKSKGNQFQFTPPILFFLILKF